MEGGGGGSHRGRQQSSSTWKHGGVNNYSTNCDKMYSDRDYEGVINAGEMAFKIDSATLQETATFPAVWEEAGASEFPLSVQETS